MRAQQIKAVRTLAQSLEVNFDRPIDDRALHGCGLPEFNGPVYVTLQVVVYFVRYQCAGVFSRTYWDENEWESLVGILRRKVQVCPIDIPTAFQFAGAGIDLSCFE